jgi:hypothetical protein
MNTPELQIIEPSDVYGPDPKDEITSSAFEKIDGAGGFSDDGIA